MEIALRLSTVLKTTKETEGPNPPMFPCRVAIRRHGLIGAKGGLEPSTPPMSAGVRSR
jgi:hypothetical protein